MFYSSCPVIGQSGRKQIGCYAAQRCSGGDDQARAERGKNRRRYPDQSRACQGKGKQHCLYRYQQSYQPPLISVLPGKADQHFQVNNTCQLQDYAETDKDDENNEFIVWQGC